MVDCSVHSVSGFSLKEVKILSAPAAENNKDCILNVIKENVDLQKNLFALELASGTGQHVVHFAENLPNVTWLPSDCEKNCVYSTAGYMMQKSQLNNILPPAFIDVSLPVCEWNVSSLKQNSCDLIVCINMIHITDMKAIVGLFKAAGELLKPGAILLTYGPYMQDGVISPESNVRFNHSLQSSNPDWGLKDVRDLEKMARENCMSLVKKISMPANNFVLIFMKSN